MHKDDGIMLCDFKISKIRLDSWIPVQGVFVDVDDWHAFRITQGNY